MTKHPKKPEQVTRAAIVDSRAVSREQRVAELARESGETATSIAHRLTAEGFTSASRATIGRALAALRGPQRMGRLAPTPGRAALPAATPTTLPSDETVAASGDLTQLDGWLGIASDMARDARKRGDNALLARAGSLAVTILEARRKAEPPASEADGTWLSANDAALSDSALASRLAAVVRHVRERMAAGEAAPGSDATLIERALWGALS